MLVRLIGTLILSAALLLPSAPSAQAHAALSSSTPADGARIESAPTEVSLTFNQDIQPRYFTLAVIGPDEKDYGVGPARVQNNTMSVSLNGLGPAGSYTVGFRVVSADGHPIEGLYRFELTRPSTGVGKLVAEPVATSGDSSIPFWLIALGAFAVLVIGGAVVLVIARLRNR
ncbi:copper resistance CopC family protein [Gordonia sp. IITR100]|uniref:copper resistance CopC family protein n=1 Tax=Gordonia sp. IITR100 TaxID=1314686 RepID=UPI0009910869|nr:copper resistance CopC family protein [Gordonia sp. IITR100]